jgi:hypothetical protein
LQPVLHGAQGIGAGVLLGRLAGRASIRSKIGIGIGNGVFGIRVVSWLGWPRGTRTSRDGWKMCERVLDFHSL